MKSEIKDILTKLHFYLLGFVLFNVTLKTVIEISLNYRLAYLIVLLVYLSGIILFLLNFKPLEKMAIYYGLFLIPPILTLFFFMFGGVFLAVLTSIALHPIYPNEVKLENENIIVHTKFQGFLSSCCLYQVNEKKYWLLEKEILEINLNQEIDFEKGSIKSLKEISEIKLPYDKFEDDTAEIIEMDTIIIVKSR